MLLVGKASDIHVLAKALFLALIRIDVRDFIEVTKIPPRKVEALGVGEYRATRPKDRIFIVFRDEPQENEEEEEGGPGE